jgi:hypothetical protein
MANRFGRNQKRKLTAMVVEAQARAMEAKGRADQVRRDADQKLAQALREHLAVGRIPLEVEHFMDREQHALTMHVIFDERRSNLHYQHRISPRELELQRDRDERERLGLYIGRAIADRLAEAYAGKMNGTSRAAA